jgi:response regulator NasT
MERNNMTEPEAYRYLQKNSMDMGRTLLETAYMILSLGAG